MTTDEARDELAMRAGWKWIAMGRSHQLIHPSPTSTASYMAMVECEPYRWVRDGKVLTENPYPPTLDGANAAVPCGWKWARCPRGSDAVWVWVGIHAETGRHIDVPDTGDPVHDLYALALACVKAGEASR